MNKEKIIAFLAKVHKNTRPWLLYIGLFVILRYTGLISAASNITQSALLKTGVLDASISEDKDIAKNFDYDFRVVDLQNNTVDVSSFKGKTLFINLWATWCGPCRVEMPSIQNLYNTVDKDKVVFIILSLDHKDPYAKVTKFVQDKEFNFPVYLPASELPSQLQVKSIPTTFIVDSKGKIVQKETGVTNFDTDQFRKFLEGL
jgi:thiol-disulfide isomerase/thioredoxin